MRILLTKKITMDSTIEREREKEREREREKHAYMFDL